MKDMRAINPDGDPRRLPGFTKKSFAMNFNGSEIWFEHIDGIYGFEELVLEKLAADRPECCRPSATSLICFNLDETVITGNILAAVVDMLLNSGKRFTRVGFVGADRRTAKRLRAALAGANFQTGFYDDFQKAKEWLVP